MTVRDVYQQVDTVAGRIRVVRRRILLARAGLMSALIGGACYLAANIWPVLTLPLQLIFVVSAAALLMRALQFAWRGSSDFAAAARRLEADFPDLQTRLLAAVEQRPDVLTGRFNLLQSKLFAEVGDHARTHDWLGVISPATLAQGWRRQWAALLALLVVACGVVMLPQSSRGIASLIRSSAALNADPPTEYAVDPGDADLERNSTLLVLLRFHSQVPRDVSLLWIPIQGAAEHVRMTKSLDDPIFAARLEKISSDGTYRLEFEGAVSRDYHVTVYDLPALVHSSITMTAPGYTGRGPQTLDSAVSATVIEGSQVRLDCRVNKPLASAVLRDHLDGTSITLTESSEDPRLYQAAWQPDRSRIWRLHLQDADGRVNRDPDEFALEVVPNRRPDLKPVFPGPDERASALQEIALEARAADDFGILSAGLVLDIAGREQQVLPISEALSGGESHPLLQLLTLENYGLSPGEVVTYSYFADDYGPDGNRRRTLSDLYFIEIRPFEESYRQMESAGGQSGREGASSGQNQTLDKLIDLQKQIVTAAWNLNRSDPDLGQPEPQAAVETLRESQKQAREQLEKVAGALGSAVPAERIAAVGDSMDEARQEFAAAQETKQRDHLAAALKAAQAAFQGLTRLRAKDHRIMQGGQAGGGAGGGGSMSQQQLNQLELNEQANRYETEKQARETADQSPQKENLAILNRLKELAQRQQGLNEKLKEIDAELRTAQAAVEREELERQLKQLREEQQDLLQDADAVRNRLQQSPDPTKTADVRKQLEQTRQQLVDASESLQEGKLAQALNSGTRAERDLQKLQDDFRKQTSGQLAESLQELRNQARELMETEEKVAEDLARLGDPQDKSLRQRQQREQLAETLHEQHQRLEETLKDIRQTVQSAESSEPLAAKHLYEAARKAQQQKTEQALQATQQLLQRGFLPEAAQAEKIARTGLETLKEGIDEAAELILGDEVADLKRAKRELAELAAELQQEMSQANGESPATENEAENPADKPGDENQPGGKPSTEESPPGSPNETGSTPGSTPPDAPSENASSAPGGKGGLRRGKPKTQPPSQPGQGTAQPSNSEGGQQGGPGGQGGPITGGSYGNWSDRLRDVETLVNDPELQAEVSKIREEARSMRAEFKRHSKLPNWDVVEEDVRQPLVELQRRLAEEIARRESPEALVPTDRDPVPEQYRELVRKYYERLGGGAK